VYFGAGAAFFVVVACVLVGMAVDDHPARTDTRVAHDDERP